MGSVFAYSISEGYVHKFLEFFAHKEFLGVYFTGKNNFADECFGAHKGAVLYTNYTQKSIIS